ncbi:MAG TPA: alcohol dehydrogenase, partial [Cytophagales bacterium]|nr:alcohol dehydrogenase [Cytophagales bacterium]
DRVLINGAAGGVGSFAIPMAKAMGAHVTGVDNAGKLDLMRQWGADEVLDYRKTEYTAQDERYDVVLDNVMQHPRRNYRRVLTPTGRAEIVGGKMKYVMPTLFKTILNRKTPVRVVLHNPNATDLGRLLRQWQDGVWTPQLDGSYSLEEGPKAFARIGSGEVRGKAVVTL